VLNLVVTIDEILWWVATALNFLFALLLWPRVIKAKKANVPSYMNYFLGVVLFFIIHGTCRVFYLMYDYYFTDPISDVWLWNVGAILGVASITVLIFFIENIIIKKTHHFFTIFGIVGIGVFIVGSNIPAILIYGQSVFVTTLALIVPLFYLVFAYQTTGSVRNNSILMFFGILIFEISQVAHSEAAWKMFPDLKPLFQLLGAIFMLAGLAIIYISVSRSEV